MEREFLPMTREIQGNTEKISEFTVRRLSNYFRLLRELEIKGVSTVSSARLAELGGITSAQVRKDLSYFGNFGTRGLGYKVTELKDAVVRILGLNHRWGMALFGAGSLGHALFFHDGFREDGFYFTHVYDVEPTKIGTTWKDVEIRHLREAEDRLRAAPVEIGVLTTPRETAQEVVDLMARVGVKGVLNFAPTRLELPDNMWLRNVNLAVALESLSFYLSM
jgi:redox-sensing transcriptional repressor